MKTSFYEILAEKSRKGIKQLAVLIDPDSLQTETDLLNLIDNCNLNKVDLILVGGSLITNGFWDQCIELLKTNTKIPVVLFPGNIMQTHKEADAILFLSMISGRNPDLLIGKHVLAAPLLKKSGIEVIPTGYMIVDGGNITSVMYMSNTTPLPSDKNNIAACTALAGEMLGLKVIYMDAGSGAKNPISSEMIAEVKSQITGPLFIGGGIRTAQQAIATCMAGADIVVVGNAIEKDPSLVGVLVQAIHSLNPQIAD
ncbi:MAG: geranylgeranylglyceryl/heptaprenylglyceryl phosphate synthase [Bacteroidia bacterium]|nr:geranylgeranylglyceryl/heptaprenylglyceryl phosphate synthase [Bacteroidia bacterium]MCF8425720.1 geranylgeranylglyceryl/heptaprenylglyceryl phosphate synthase [Bacteroidia bacterium]MCF8448068.1 geranylgeranylglyceryl/heptaprenylglyceryl phosphate synthase [Bacteroidia bacterium]